MRGERPSLKDIVLEPQDEAPAEELVLQANLLSDESLSPDDVLEEELKVLYKIDGECGTCRSRIRLVVGATEEGIRGLQHLLLAEVDLICVSCAKEFRHGRK